jgi:hypothetical protein
VVSQQHNTLLLAVKNIRNLDNCGGNALIPPVQCCFTISFFLTYFCFLFARFDIHPTSQPLPHQPRPPRHSEALRARFLFASHYLNWQDQHFVETQSGI